METAVIEKLVNGGQGLGTLPDGKKVFVWNALPGEEVSVRLIKSKRDWAEGIAEAVIKPSPDRIEPLDASYLSTSPWQIMTFEAENRAKQAILAEAIGREKIAYGQPIEFMTAGPELRYRNKMEYSFWADDSGLHLALFHRGSHGKQIVQGSSIARPEIDKTAQKICSILNAAGIRGSQLKTVVVRCSQAGQAVAALFVKDDNFPVITELAAAAQGVAVYFSNPKSPASLATKQLYAYGDLTLTDIILGTPVKYGVNSFFQVNLPVFELAAGQIRDFVAPFGRAVDFYSGVGTIGLPAGASTLVESDRHNVEMAKHNAKGSKTEVIHAAAEAALDHIPSDGVLIVDPPRAGLHSKVIDRIREAKPVAIAYLSCNPATQARDLALLQNTYEIKSIVGYNFFPRTPHIEALAFLTRQT